MDIRSSDFTRPTLEHQGTTPVWWLVPPREMREETLGGHLELISEFEIRAGGEVNTHHHPTYEFYFMLSGRALMTIEDETREIGPGDLVKIPPNARHSIKPAHEHNGIRALAMAFGVKDAPVVDYSTDPESY
ncbi:cupin domain-containing protein [Aminobacter anthyllidis]|uniref:Cupin domain-containing protein n=1 Tax=Aminobacter anthyllidis TaxID=1035067 RepID=A0A9X1D7J6_9HYPH|nr:cupin domain-containing protein [Aminobacter anthyllidis]MBT1158206.1 cupin domain-containing protein [Aminobacter anthyllidis]MDH4986532.1 cupin domain-containing protein [Aminobacter anthyllidis]